MSAYRSSRVGSEIDCDDTALGLNADVAVMRVWSPNLEKVSRARGKHNDCATPASLLWDQGYGPFRCQRGALQASSGPAKFSYQLTLL
jgi:hypothetical protein